MSITVKCACAINQQLLCRHLSIWFCRTTELYSFGSTWFNARIRAKQERILMCITSQEIPDYTPVSSARNRWTPTVRWMIFLSTLFGIPLESPGICEFCHFTRNIPQCSCSWECKTGFLVRKSRVSTSIFFYVKEN